MPQNSGYHANHAIILQPCDQTPFLSSLFNDESGAAQNHTTRQMRSIPSRDRYMAIHGPIFQGMPVYIPPPGYCLMSPSPTPSPSPYSEQENDPLYRPYNLAGMRQKMIQCGPAIAKHKTLKQKLPGFAMFSNSKRPKLSSDESTVEGDDKIEEEGGMFHSNEEEQSMQDSRIVQYTGMHPPPMAGEFRSPATAMNPPDFYVSELRVNQSNQILDVNGQYMRNIQYADPNNNKLIDAEHGEQYQNMPKVSPTITPLSKDQDNNYLPQVLPTFQEGFLPQQNKYTYVPPDKRQEQYQNNWHPMKGNFQCRYYEQDPNNGGKFFNKNDVPLYKRSDQFSTASNSSAFEKITPYKHDTMQMMPLIMYPYPPDNNNKRFVYSHIPPNGQVYKHPENKEKIETSPKIVEIPPDEEEESKEEESGEKGEEEEEEEEGGKQSDKEGEDGKDNTTLDKVREVFLSFVDQSDDSINKLEPDAKTQMFMNVCNMYKSLSVISITSSLSGGTQPPKLEELNPDGTIKEVSEGGDEKDENFEELEPISDDEVKSRTKTKSGEESDSDYIKHSPGTELMSRVARRPCTRPPNSLDQSSQDSVYLDKDYDNKKHVNVCGFCGKCFPSNSSLKVHTNLHTGNKPHICSFCKRGFGDPSNLKRHLRIHTRSRPYTCHLCPTSFNQSSHLVRHIRSHTSRGCHKTCRFCSASFPHYSNLRRHSERCAERRKRENILLIQDTKQSGESLAFKLPHLTSKPNHNFELPEPLIQHNTDMKQYEDRYNGDLHKTDKPEDYDTYSRLIDIKPSVQ